MEISQYDEYIPEKELNINFKIPRKRTADDSFGAEREDAFNKRYAETPQTRQHFSNQPQRQRPPGQMQFSTLSDGERRASSYFDPKAPVRYPSIPDSTFKPPLPLSNFGSNISEANNRSNLTSSNIFPSFNSNSMSQIKPWGQASNTTNNANVQNKSWDESGNQSWGEDEPSNFRSRGNESQNRSWSVGNGDRSFNEESSLYTRNRSFGGNSNRSWDGDNDNTNSKNEWGSRSWKHNDNDNDDWGMNNSGGNNRNSRNNSFGGREDFDMADEFPGDKRQDPDVFDNRRLERNEEPVQRFNSPGGFSRGPDLWEPRGNRNEQQGGRGMRPQSGQDSMGRGRGAAFGRGGGMFNSSEFDNRRGGFRGGRGRGSARYFNDNDRTRENWRPFQRKEKPKNTNQNTSPAKIPDMTDETLPKELRAMFQPLYCKLCSLQMSSNVMAKMHYKCKNHEKKIRRFLIEHSEKTGEPLHPRTLTTATQEKKEKEEDKDPKYFHCDVCDLPLTGKLHAESHYMGRNHNAVLMGKKRPAGKGYYNEEGKWVRKVTEVKKDEGDDNFGLAFRKPTDDSTDQTDKSDAATAAVEVATPEDKTSKFTCSICNVCCTCQEQINMHFNGAKHRKKLKLLGISPENFEVPKELENEDENKTGTADSKLDSVEATAVERNDFSRYKTPSGYYYCQKCNLTLNSEVQLKQHLTSKNHLKKAIKTEQSSDVKKIE